MGGVAELVLLPTGDLSRQVEDLLPPRAQVYGGAGRSYPVGFASDPDWRRSPLRFPASSPSRATALLIADVLAQAHAAGLFKRMPLRSRSASGTVSGFTAGGTRAFVQLDDGSLAMVCAELSYPPTPLDWTLARGQRLTAILDEDTRRLTLPEPTPTSAEVAAAFPHCSVTLALVESVAPGGSGGSGGSGSDIARLALHPRFTLEVRRADVSPNPLDTLDLLLTEGEVVRVRVVHLAGGALHLRLADVDDDEPVLPPLALVDGGPPWLVEGRSLPSAVALEAELTDAALVVVGAAEPAMPVVPDDAGDVPVAVALVAPLTPAAARAAAEPRPMPGPGTRRVSVADAAGPEASVTAASPALAAPPGQALQQTQLSLAQAKARVAELEQRVRDAGASDSHLARLRERARRHEQLTREARADLGEALAEIAALKDRAAKSTSALRAARAQPVAAAAYAALRSSERRDAWPDDESWIRHEILLAWVERIPASEKASLALPVYAVGPDFAAAMLALDAAQFRKATKTVVDALTGRAERMPGRDAHRLRTADSGGSPYRTRDDGAHCMRVAIEQNTAAARRLHYWVLPGGGVELSRVVTHDVMEA